MAMSEFSWDFIGVMGREHSWIMITEKWGNDVSTIDNSLSEPLFCPLFPQWQERETTLLSPVGDILMVVFEERHHWY